VLRPGWSPGAVGADHFVLGSAWAYPRSIWAAPGKCHHIENIGIFAIPSVCLTAGMRIFVERFARAPSRGERKKSPRTSTQLAGAKALYEARGRAAVRLHAQALVVR